MNMRRWLCLLLACLTLPLTGIGEGQGTGLSVTAPTEEVHPWEAILIRYTLPEAGTADLALTDENGNELLPVASGVYGYAGQNTLYWNGTWEHQAAPEGEWFLRISSGGQQAQTRILIGAPLPEDTPAPAEESFLEEEAASEPQEETLAEEEEDYAAEPTYTETVTTYVWPVQGGVEVPYAMETLLYDATMADWRTHDGVDIACSLGDEVLAAADGLVAGVREDDLYGTVVEIDHQNGVHSIYANLASQPLVSEGDRVTMGQTIGSVGKTALAETNVVPHLHLAMTLDGVRTDPMNYLPERLGE